MPYTATARPLPPGFIIPGDDKPGKPRCSYLYFVCVPFRLALRLKGRYTAECCLHPVLGPMVKVFCGDDDPVAFARDYIDIEAACFPYPFVGVGRASAFHPLNAPGRGRRLLAAAWRAVKAVRRAAGDLAPGFCRLLMRPGCGYCGRCYRCAASW